MDTVQREVDSEELSYLIASDNTKIALLIWIELRATIGVPARMNEQLILRSGNRQQRPEKVSCSSRLHALT